MNLALRTDRAPWWSILLFSACTGMDSGPAHVPGPATGPSVSPNAERGRTLYEVHCVVCHGMKGDGRGEAAYLLSPLPRDFGSGRFRLVSTENGVPSQEDLVAVLRRGMPGSAMPPFEWLRADEHESLALHVRQLAEEGLVAGLRRYAQEEGEEFDEAEAREIARAQSTPGPTLDLGPAPPESAELVARGRELYQESCAPCHGADGRAREVDVQWNEDGTPTRAAIVRRLRCGLPGSPMPATELATPDDAWALASFVTSLVRPGAEERVLQRRATLAVHRARTLPLDPADEAWKRVAPAYLALMPLWWRDERIEGVELRALHDGRGISIHVSWKDPTRDDELLGTETFSDLAALQLSAEPDPHLFAMGAAGRVVDLWIWKAAWEREREGARDVVDRYPNLSADLHGHQPADAAPLFLTARALGNPAAVELRASAGEELTAQGLGTVAPRSAAEPSFRARGEWRDGSWSVVFSRAMEVAGSVSLAPGSRAYLAAAVWDGAATDRNGQKSITVWHVLDIER
jgi:mono/diheme cytochrome c family protein